MGKKKTYDQDFKLETIRLVKEQGRSVKSVANDLGVHEITIYKWLRQHNEEGDRAFGDANSLTPQEKELRALKKENDDLKEEIAILKKAAAIFAKHSK